MIGHLKSDARMKYCFLTGLMGDAINANLAAAGLNLRELLRGLVFALIFTPSGGVERRFDGDYQPHGTAVPV